MAGGLERGGAARGDVGGFAGAFARWWLAELGGLVPGGFKARAASRPAAFGCSLFADGRIAFARLASAKAPLPGPERAVAPSDLLSAEIAAALAGTSRRSVRLSVPASLCLIRRTRIPGRALPHAGAILAAEIEELMPLAASDLLFDWYVETEDPATRELHLVQVVLARSRIAEVAERLGGAGLTLTRLTVGEAEGRMVPVDLMSGRDATVRAFLARLPRRAKLAAALAAVGLLAAPVLVSARQAAALDALTAEADAARASGPAARSASAVADALEGFGRRSPVSALLDEVARRLPAEVHLTRLQAGEGRLVLSTLGGDAARTRAAFAGSTVFSSAEPLEGASDTLVLTLAESGAAGSAPFSPGAP